MTDLAYESATRLADAVRRRTVSPVELVQHTLDRIEQRNADVNAFVTLVPEKALDEARVAEKAVMTGAPLPPLHGLPIAIKDLDAAAGIRTTRGSRLFAEEVPPVSMTVVDRLQRAGAIVVGKTNAPEFGHKAITDNFLFGPTSTPFDLSMNAGGSSGGSAAAVAEGMVPFAQGSDAGGSLRVPGSFCGVFAMMPTFGRVPVVVRPNAFLLLNPMVCYGPLTRTVADAVLMLDVMSGPHVRDPYSLPRTHDDWSGALTRPMTGMRVAFSVNLGGFPVEPDVEKVVRDSVAALAEDGATVREIDLKLPYPHTEYTALWRRLQAVRQAEFAARMKQAGVDILADHADDIAPEYIELLRTGSQPSAVDYRLEDGMRTELLDVFEDLFDNYDVIVSPVTSVAGVPNMPGGNTIGPAEVEGQQVNPLVGWCLTGLYNYIASPAASVPAGQTPAGLPVGLQVAGRRFDEAAVLTTAAALERRRPWHQDYLALDRRRAAALAR